MNLNNQYFFLFTLSGTESMTRSPYMFMTYMEKYTKENAKKVNVYTFLNGGDKKWLPNALKRRGKFSENNSNLLVKITIKILLLDY